MKTTVLFRMIVLVAMVFAGIANTTVKAQGNNFITCLLYTSDAADDLLCVDLCGCRIIKKKINKNKKKKQ